MIFLIYEYQISIQLRIRNTHTNLVSEVSSDTIVFGQFKVYAVKFGQVKPQSHLHGFGPGRATVHPDLASR